MLPWDVGQAVRGQLEPAVVWLPGVAAARAPAQGAVPPVVAAAAVATAVDLAIAAAVPEPPPAPPPPPPPPPTRRGRRGRRHDWRPKPPPRAPPPPPARPPLDVERVRAYAYGGAWAIAAVLVAIGAFGRWAQGRFGVAEALDESEEEEDDDDDAEWKRRRQRRRRRSRRVAEERGACLSADR